MVELVGYPFINQLNSATLDGRPDENKWMNCTICSILSAMFYWKPELRGTITPDSMKDAVLGEGYANKGTDAAWFVPFVAQYGLILRPIKGTPGHLVEMGHQLIQQGLPAIFTEIDPYVDTSLPQYAGWTHVCSWYKEIAGGGLDAMDPFGGKLVALDDSQWAVKLSGDTLWTVEKEAEDVPVVIDLNNPEVANFFSAGPGPGQWTCKKANPQGKFCTVQGAILAEYARYGNAALCGLTFLGLPLSQELQVGNGVVKQFFERAALVYDPNHTVDFPPGAGAVYPLHLYNGGIGEDPFIAQQSAAYKALQAQNAALQAKQQAPSQVSDPPYPAAAIATIRTATATIQNALVPLS